MAKKTHNAQQNSWVNGSTFKTPVKIEVAEESEFYTACNDRETLINTNETDPAAWLALANRFQAAAGTRHSYLAEWCKKRAEALKKG
jgi:hypothetical protein